LVGEVLENEMLDPLGVEVVVDDLSLPVPYVVTVQGAFHFQGAERVTLS